LGFDEGLRAIFDRRHAAHLVPESSVRSTNGSDMTKKSAVKKAAIPITGAVWLPSGLSL